MSHTLSRHIFTRRDLKAALAVASVGLLGYLLIRLRYSVGGLGRINNDRSVQGIQHLFVTVIDVLVKPNPALRIETSRQVHNDDRYLWGQIDALGFTGINDGLQLGTWVFF